MNGPVKRFFVLCLLGLLSGVFSGIEVARAVEVGEAAPDFKLPATTGADLGLSDFKGKKWVFLEFYGIDFQPT